jgi:hypothetical protein
MNLNVFIAGQDMKMWRKKSARNVDSIIISNHPSVPDAESILQKKKKRKMPKLSNARNADPRNMLLEKKDTAFSKPV